MKEAHLKCFPSTKFSFFSLSLFSYCFYSHLPELWRPHRLHPHLKGFSLLFTEWCYCERAADKSVPTCAQWEPQWWKCTCSHSGAPGQMQRLERAMLSSRYNRTRITAWSSSVKCEKMHPGRGLEAEQEMLEPCYSKCGPWIEPFLHHLQEAAQAPLPTWWIRIFNPTRIPVDSCACWSLRSTALKNPF